MRPDLLNDTPNETYRLLLNQINSKTELKPLSGPIKNFLSIPFLWDTLYKKFFRQLFGKIMGYLLKLFGKAYLYNVVSKRLENGFPAIYVQLENKILKSFLKYPENVPKILVRRKFCDNWFDCPHVMTWIFIILRVVRPLIKRGSGASSF